MNGPATHIPMVRNMRATLMLLSMLTIGAAMTGSVQAQTKQSVWDGVYTDAQAGRGAGQYTDRKSVV